MTDIISNEKPIDPNDPVYTGLLDDLQGNIVKSHGRDHVFLWLIEFTCGPELARTWLRTFGDNWVKSASTQAQQIIDYRANKTEALFANLFLTKRGYDYIGLEDKQIPTDPKFRGGMLGSQAILKDPSGDKWEPPYDPVKNPIHAMALLAATTPSKFQANIEHVAQSLSGLAKVTPQEGRAYRDNARKEESRRYVEHFNFLDGRSQPLFLQEDLDEEEDLDGTSDYNPFSPLSLVLVKDPNGGKDGYGSYLVYRKLEQNVQGFKERQQSLADELGLKAADDRKRVGAMVIGRFENGTPIALSDHSNLRSAPNNFHYDDDSQGLKCPLFAHTRKMNPRVDTKEARSHRIVRRGISYENTQRLSPSSEQSSERMPKNPVGLLFMCFQSSIEGQFEYLQRIANDDDPDQPTRKVGIDPLIGQGGEGAQWPKEWGKGLKINARFGNFVALKGGEYFFAPSLSFFEGL